MSTFVLLFIYEQLTIILTLLKEGSRSSLQYMVLGRGKFLPLSILHSCGWTNNKIDTRQIKRRKRNKF